MTAIITLGEKIGQITHVDFRASTLSGSKTGWDGEGHGTVTAISSLQNAHQVVHLHESGEFRLTGARPVPFRNIYRLTWYAQRISLHHERRGEDNAVWLFDLVPDLTRSDLLVSQVPHVCGSDTYSAQLTLTAVGFNLYWTIQGTRKNERLDYRYTIIDTTRQS